MASKKPGFLEKPGFYSQLEGEVFMKSGIIAVLALGAIAGAESPLLAQLKGRDARADRHGWISSLEQGKAQAHSSGKPLMVVLRCVP